MELENDCEEGMRGVIRRERRMEYREIGGDRMKEWREGGKEGRERVRKEVRDVRRNDNFITVMSK